MEKPYLPIHSTILKNSALNTNLARVCIVCIYPVLLGVDWRKLRANICSDTNIVRL